MCLSTAPARFSNTILYAGVSEVAGTFRHVIGYQNTAASLRPGPNCMILPLPSRGDMGPGNILDTSEARHLLRDMRNAIEPQRSTSRGATFGVGGEPSALVQVFDHDVFTICLGRVGADFESALATVNAARRPNIPDGIVRFFETRYRGYHLAMCCFNNIEAQTAAPMLWQYEPANPNVIVAPAIDEHDGTAPKLGARVPLDHILIASAPGLRGTRVNYTDPIPEPLRAFAPRSVLGVDYRGEEAANGDFLIDVGRMANTGLRGAVTRGILSISA